MGRHIGAKVLVAAEIISGLTRCTSLQAVENGRRSEIVLTSQRSRLYREMPMPMRFHLNGQRFDSEILRELPRIRNGASERSSRRRRSPNSMIRLLDFVQLEPD
jgi:hypothetical protein